MLAVFSIIIRLNRLRDQNASFLHILKNQRSTKIFSANYSQKHGKNLRTKFSFRPFVKFKKAAQKPTVKKVTKLTTAAFFSMTLKSFVEKAFADEKEKIEKSLSYKMAKKKTLEEFQAFFNQIAKDWIRDPQFTLQEVIKALEREQNAQENGNIVGYHTMTEAIRQTLKLYSIFYDQVNNIKPQDNFFYLRTFDTIKNAEGIAPIKFLEKLFYESIRKESFDEIEENKNYIFAMSPWLIQDVFYESALGRSVSSDIAAKKIMQSIIKDICMLYNIKSNACVDDIMKLFSQDVFEKRVLLQIIFNQNTNKPLSEIQYNPNKFEFSSMYVGSNEKNVAENLYWSRSWGIPSYFKLDSSNLGSSNNVGTYDGPEMYREMLYGKKVPKTAKYAQLRLIVTPEWLSKRSYEIHTVLGNDEENTKKLVEKVGNILYKYQQISAKTFDPFEFSN